MIKELNVLMKCQIILVSHNDKFVIPSGSTMIEGGDVLLELANAEDFSVLQSALARLKE